MRTHPARIHPLVSGRLLPFWKLGLIGILTFLLAACGGRGPVRRVSQPAASIQQLSVRADGRWELQLRFNNYSSMPMRFDAANLDLAFDNGLAARLEPRPNLEIGPESADTHTLTLQPTPAGMARIATALADGHGLSYTLEGNVQATPDGAGGKTWKIKTSSALTPVPGLPGTLR